MSQLQHNVAMAICMCINTAMITLTELIAFLNGQLQENAQIMVVVVVIKIA